MLSPHVRPPYSQADIIRHSRLWPGLCLVGTAEAGLRSHLAEALQLSSKYVTKKE
jgi:hypothetical protein